MAFLDQVLLLVPAGMPAWLAILIPFLVSEVLMRAIPTAKPKSWLIFISSGLKKIAAIFEKVSGVLDQVIQTLKDDPAPPPAPPAPPAA